MVRHFLATIPGQRFVELGWKFVRMFDERINDGLGVFAGHSDEHHVTRLTLNQGRDLAVMATDVLICTEI